MQWRYHPLHVLLRPSCWCHRRCWCHRCCWGWSYHRCRRSHGRRRHNWSSRGHGSGRYDGCSNFRLLWCLWNLLRLRSGWTWSQSLPLNPSAARPHASQKKTTSSWATHVRVILIAANKLRAPLAQQPLALPALQGFQWERRLPLQAREVFRKTRWRESPSGQTRLGKSNIKGTIKDESVG